MQVIAIGGATIDVVVAGACWTDVADAKQDVQSITMGVGGGAVNAALAMRARDAHVRLVCAVGGDAEAQWMRGVLGTEGIDLSLVQSVGSVPTGKAVIHLDAGGDSRVFAQRGASMQVSPSRALDAIGRCELLYVTALSAHAEAELAASLERLGQAPAMLAINPGMRQLQACSPALERLLALAGMVSMNEAEARQWASHLGLRLPDDPTQQAEAWMGRLRRHDGQVLVVTLGGRGALLHDGRRVHLSPARRVAIRSTLGAGDAFAATLACCWAEGLPPAACLEDAQAHCAKVLQTPSANLARAVPQ